MLHTKTVKNELLELLNELMKIPDFKQFNLVGGTSLSLQIGHRNSVDIDLFGNKEIDTDEFLNILNSYGQVVVIKKTQNILILIVNGIKIDFVCYKYPLLQSITVNQGIRLVSKDDIAAMKLNAIAGRGSKKDFIDLYFLFSCYTLSEMLQFYQSKYKDGSVFMVIKSLTYFDDADREEEPNMFVPFNWGECKQFIKKQVKALKMD